MSSVIKNELIKKSIIASQFMPNKKSLESRQLSNEFASRMNMVIEAELQRQSEIDDLSY
jgi:hypothetical protein